MKTYLEQKIDDQISVINHIRVQLAANTIELVEALSHNETSMAALLDINTNRANIKSDLILALELQVINLTNNYRST